MPTGLRLPATFMEVVEFLTPHLASEDTPQIPYHTWGVSEVMSKLSTTLDHGTTGTLEVEETMSLRRLRAPFEVELTRRLTWSNQSATPNLEAHITGRVATFRSKSAREHY